MLAVVVIEGGGTGRFPATGTEEARRFFLACWAGLVRGTVTATAGGLAGLGCLGMPGERRGEEENGWCVAFFEFFLAFFGLFLVSVGRVSRWSLI